MEYPPYITDESLQSVIKRHEDYYEVVESIGNVWVVTALNYAGQVIAQDGFTTYEESLNGVRSLRPMA